MNILQVVSSLEIGGVTSVVVNLANALSDSNNVTIAIYGDNAFVHNLLCEKVKVVKFKSFKEYIELIKSDNIDIVHFHIMLKTGIFALITKLFTKAKIVCHAHSSADFTLSFFYIRIYKPISKFLIRHYVDLRLSCSDLAGKYLYGSSRFKVIYNAIDSKKYAFDNGFRQEIRSKYNLTDEFVLGFVGHVHAIKNLEFLCEVISKLNDPHAKLLIVGGFTEDEDLESRIKSYPFVSVTGIVNDAYKYYSAFDAFVLPSLSEGMPMVAIEAQANGLECYLSDTITRQVNMNNKCHYVALNNIHEWNESLAKTITVKREYANNCIESKFDISQMKKDICDLYSRIL